jgi:hypothetical protein
MALLYFLISFFQYCCFTLWFIFIGMLWFFFALSFVSLSDVSLLAVITILYTNILQSLYSNFFYQYFRCSYLRTLSFYVFPFAQFMLFLLQFIALGIIYVPTYKILSVDLYLIICHFNPEVSFSHTCMPILASFYVTVRTGTILFRADVIIMNRSWNSWLCASF